MEPDPDPVFGIADEEASVWIAGFLTRYGKPIDAELREAYRQAFLVGFITSYRLALKGELPL